MTIALCAVAAGVLATALDVYQAIQETSGLSQALLLILQVFGLVVMTSVVVALAGWGIYILGNFAGKRMGRNAESAGAAALAATLSPGALYMAIRLFQGGVTSQLPARPALIGGVTVLLTSVFFITARMGIALLRRGDEKPGSRLVLGAIPLIFGLAVTLRWSDAHLYKRLYLYLHVALALATIAGLTFGFRLLATKLARKNLPLLGKILLPLVAVAAIGGRLSEDVSQTVKVALYEGTATAANIKIVTAGPRQINDRARPSEAARLRVYEQERADSLAAASFDFPTFPGAHLLLITVDALRADKLGTYGYTARALSPEIDKFAAGATVFERAYCPAPHSSYSLSSLHTSHYTYDEGMLGSAISHPTIAQVLSEAGYETTGFYTQGIFFTEGDKVEHYRKVEFGFDTAIHGAPRPQELTDLAIADMDRLLQKGEPAFFSWVHYFNVHEPYLSRRFGDAPRDRYEGEVLETDGAIARLIEYAQTKLARDTIIVISSDHGEEFEEHGGHYHGSTLYEEQTHVPLIIKVPGAQPARIASPVSTIDFVPTALRLLGLKPLDHMVGQDLRPGIFGGNDKHIAKPVFSSVMRRHMVVKWPWKLISDPSRGLYELYNLEVNHSETTNVYDGNKDLAAQLLDDTNAWLDEIAQGRDEAQTALNMGKMRDPRAVPGLVAVAINTGAPVTDRVDALKLLGDIRPWKYQEQLALLLKDPNTKVATFAALALASLHDERGAAVLREALYDDDPSVRDKAAIALGEMGDTIAVPVLIESLGRVDLKVREDAIRLLGNLRDPSAVEPLIETISEDRTRYLTVLALGMIGNLKAYNTLMDVLEYEKHVDIKGYVVVALGWLEAEGPEQRLMEILRDEPEITWTSESLVRLGAIEKGLLGGIDLNKDQPAKRKGWGACTEDEKVVPDRFMDRTTCLTDGPRATLRFPADFPDGAAMIIRAMTAKPSKKPVTLDIQVDGKPMGSMELSGSMNEVRIQTPPGTWTPGPHDVHLATTPPVLFRVDHLLLLPQAPQSPPTGP